MGAEWVTGEDASDALSLSYPAVATSVSAARNAVAAFAAEAGANATQLETIRLACSEALSNVVLHAYPGGNGDIQVTARVAGRELWVLIADEGGGIDPTRESAGLGLGLVIVAALTEEFWVAERSMGGIELRMCFAVGPVQSEPEPDGAAPLDRVRLADMKSLGVVDAMLSEQANRLVVAHGFGDRLDS